MKIAKVRRDDHNIYIVEFKPNWIQRLFGMKPKEVKYKRSTSQTFTYGGGGVYFTQSGEKVSNNNPVQKAIDAYRRAF